MKKFIMVFAGLLAFFVQPAFAEVITMQTTEGYAKYVYVAGTPDNYPIEYYDENLEKYCGIIPDLLECIFQKSGVDFAYINGNKVDKNIIGENLQADIISSSVNDSSLAYYKDYLELLSYEKDGKVLKLGLIFTSIADDAVVLKIKAAANGISEDVKSGRFLSYMTESSKRNYLLLFLTLGICLILIAAIVLLILYIKRIRKEHSADKMTDSETGMGNLQFFKYHFRYTISEISRSLYHVAYIILDTSYLRSYHGDSSFEDVLKYTASVLSEYTGDREISVRITENGFALAYQATNDEDAKKRLLEVMKSLIALKI